MCKKQNKKGFTLIELLAYVLIIGILMSFALPRYRFLKERSLAQQPLFWLKNSANVMRIFDLTHGNDTAFIILTHQNKEAAYDELEMYSIQGATMRSPDTLQVETEHFHYYTDDDGIVAARTYFPSYAVSYRIYVDFWPDRCGRKTINCTYYDDLGKKICSELCPNKGPTENDISCGFSQSKCVISQI